MNLERCKVCGRLAAVDEVVTIGADEYVELKRRAVESDTRRTISAYRSVSRSAIARNPEVADFILGCLPTMTIAEITAAAEQRFSDRAPSRSSIYRFVQAMKRVGLPRG